MAFSIDEFIRNSNAVFFFLGHHPVSYTYIRCFVYYGYSFPISHNYHISPLFSPLCISISSCTINKTIILYILGNNKQPYTLSNGYGLILASSKYGLIITSDITSVTFITISMIMRQCQLLIIKIGMSTK